VSTWTYVGRLPGKEIRVVRGQRLRVDLGNQLPQPSTVHWHGLTLRNDLDRGAEPHPGRRPSAYDFTVPASGTFWFHPHVGTNSTVVSTHP
jgi:FtsP/CotA-like multicopper oxidase with cupredoxin domain